MVSADKARIKALLGKTFAGTVVTDPVIDPYIIVRYEDGAFAIYEVRGEGQNTRLAILCYPSSFAFCLDKIAKELHHRGGKTYDTIRDYIEDWKKVSETVRTALGDYKIPEI